MSDFTLSEEPCMDGGRGRRRGRGHRRAGWRQGVVTVGAWSLTDVSAKGGV